MGLEMIEKTRPRELADIIESIMEVDPKRCQEKTESTRPLYSPKEIASQITANLKRRGWKTPKTQLESEDNTIVGDGLKNKVGLEIQFGRYSFLGWDSLRKIALLADKGVYEYGIEVTPMAALRQRMSKGVGSYEQVVERLKTNPNPQLKIPVIVLGIDA